MPKRETPQYTPAPDGTLGHDVRSASQRTRLGAGAEGLASDSSLRERDGRNGLYSLHSAIAEYGLPVPLDAIYRANTMSIEQLRALRGGAKGAPFDPEIIAPPLIERMAENSKSELPTPCAEWIEDIKKGKPGWIWIRSASVESSMTMALLMLRRVKMSGRVGRLVDFVALCRQAPLYGERSCETVVRAWSQERTLALAVSERDRLDVFACEMLLSLLRRRRDALLPTALAADAPGAQILTRENRSQREARLCEEIVKVLNVGLTGFSTGKSKAPRTVNLLGQTTGYCSDPDGRASQGR